MRITRTNILRIITLAVIGVFVYLIAPKPTYDPATWYDPFDRSVRRFNFSKYELPEGYNFVSYMHSIHDRKQFVVYKNKQTGQQFFILILTELPKVKFDMLSVSGKTLGRGISWYMQKIRGDTNFKLYYLVPQLINKDY